jgi:hypothetical protein
VRLESLPAGPTPQPARALRVVLLAAMSALALTGCPTRMPEPMDGRDVFIPPCEDNVPTFGPGEDKPSCSPEAVIEVGEHGQRQGNVIRLRVDTRGRRNDLHPPQDCTPVDSSEAVLHYVVPDVQRDGRRLRALRISTANCATQFDTVLSVRNECTPEGRDYVCNNDTHLDDGRMTRRSVVYFPDPEPLQNVYIVVDGAEGNVGLADVTITEFFDLGVLGAPCIPIPPDAVMSTNGALDPRRCPHDGLQCRPGASDDGTDLCLPLLPLGASCDPEQRRNVCEPYYQRKVVCAVNPRSHTEAICALPGTAAGALCRATEPRCDGRLACSPGLGFNNNALCVPLVGRGALCSPEPMGFTDRCDTGLTCCGDIPDAGAVFRCQPTGSMPCFPYVPPMP